MPGSSRIFAFKFIKYLCNNCRGTYEAAKRILQDHDSVNRHENKFIMNEHAIKNSKQKS